MPGLVGNLKKKKKSHISDLLTCFSYYLEVDIYGSLSGWGANDKKPKISRIKTEIIYFEDSNYGKKVKNLEFSENFSIFELE